MGQAGPRPSPQEVDEIARKIEDAVRDPEERLEIGQLALHVAVQPDVVIHLLRPQMQPLKRAELGQLLHRGRAW